MTQQPVWQQGWYRFAHALASPNFGPRPANTDIDLVVIHSISLPPGQYGGQEVQAHFYIRRGGELLQFVSCDDRAWHAGTSTHAGRAQCNDFSIGIELEGLEGDVFTQEQYESLSALLPMIAQQYPLQHIAGHEHIAPDRKKDPGKGFSWRFLQQSLGWPNYFFSACEESIR